MSAKDDQLLAKWGAKDTSFDATASDPSVRYRFPTTPFFDLMTGCFKRGEYGESINQGGIGQFDLIAARGNMGKTTLALDRLGLAARHLNITHISEKPIPVWRGWIKESEDQGELDRCLSVVAKYFPETMDLYGEGLFKYSSTQGETAEEYIRRIKAYAAENQKWSKKDMLPTPFFDHDGNRVMLPMCYLGITDSLTMLESRGNDEIRSKADPGSAERNMLDMRAGKFKADVVRELNAAAAHGNIRLQATVHVVDTFELDPYAPRKVINHYLTGGKLKNASVNAHFLASAIIYLMAAPEIKNQSTKGVEYPKNSFENNMGLSNSLHEVKAIITRVKSPGHGVPFTYLSSQTEGLLEHLSMYHFIRTNKFGLTSDGFSLELYPIKVTRTTVRQIIDTDPMFRRAIEVTDSLLRMRLLYPHRADEIPKNITDLLERLGKIGYKTDQILNTREAWTVFNDKNPVPFLSIEDIIRMSNGAYIPYWI